MNDQVPEGKAIFKVESNHDKNTVDLLIDSYGEGEFVWELDPEVALKIGAALIAGSISETQRFEVKTATVERAVNLLTTSIKVSKNG